MNQKNLAVILMVAIIAVAGYVGASTAADSVTQKASVTISPVVALNGPTTIDFGIVSDNRAIPTPLTTTNTLSSGSNIPIDIYTKANDTHMVNTDSSIPDTITPIQFTPETGSATDFTTGYQIARSNWQPVQGGSLANWGQVLSITVPAYTANGTYVVTIYNTAVAHGAVAPTTP